MAIRGTVVYSVVHRLPMHLMQELNVGTVHLEQLAPSLRSCKKTIFKGPYLTKGSIFKSYCLFTTSM